MLPAIGLVTFLALATHDLPRYNAPAWPIVTVLAIEMLLAPASWIFVRARERFGFAEKKVNVNVVDEVHFCQPLISR